MLNYRVKKDSPNLPTSSTRKQYDNNVIILEKISFIKLPSWLIDTICSTRTSPISTLSNSYKLLYIQIILLYQQEQYKGNTSIKYASRTLASMLGYHYNNSKMRATILEKIKVLEQHNLLKVIRTKDFKGRDQINKIIPIVPDDLFKIVNNSDSIYDQDKGRVSNESNLDYILRTKLFVLINKHYIKSIMEDDIPITQKLFYLNSYITAYMNKQKTGCFSFSGTLAEIAHRNNISTRTLERIFQNIRMLKDDSFIKLEHKYLKSDNKESNRWDRSIFKITINTSVDLSSVSTINSSLEVEPTKKEPTTDKKGAINKKDIIIKKNIDNKNYYDEVKTSKKIIENETFSFSSTSSKKNLEKEKINSSIPDTSGKVLKFYPKRTLKDWYPLSKEEVGCINWDSGREFSTNFANQLLLKLSKSNTKSVFPTKYHLRKYLTKAFKNELRQGPEVNHDTFKLKCNLDSIHAQKEKVTNQHSLFQKKEIKQKQANGAATISNPLWEKVCEKLKSALGEDLHKSWTGKLEYIEKYQKADEHYAKVIRLSAPSRFIANTIKDRYMGHVKEAFKGMGIRNADIVMEIPDKAKLRSVYS